MTTVIKCGEGEVHRAMGGQIRELSVVRAEEGFWAGVGGAGAVSLSLFFLLSWSLCPSVSLEKLCAHDTDSSLQGERELVL